MNTNPSNPDPALEGAVGNPRKEWCESLIDEHHELLEEIDGLHGWWAEAAEIGSPKFEEMGDRVAVLRKRLAEHFAHEESGGYLAEALEAAPQFTAQAKLLQQEHAELLEELDVLVDRLEGRADPFGYWNQAQAALDAILHRLEQHEHHENEIIQIAMGMDIGAAD